MTMVFKLVTIIPSAILTKKYFVSWIFKNHPSKNPLPFLKGGFAS